MRLGFIGTGTMGNPMVKCLLEAGHEVAVNDLRREATTDLCEMGATWVETPAQASEGQQVVFTSLPGPTQVEAVLLNSENGVLAGLASGSAFIDMTTNAPGVARSLSETCRLRGIDTLDAPVSGRPPGMTIMVGGERATFDRYKPILDSMGQNSTT